MIDKLDGITAEDIGVITILDHVTDIEILNGKGSLVLELMKDTTIKGKLLNVCRAKNQLRGRSNVEKRSGVRNSMWLLA